MKTLTLHVPEEADAEAIRRYLAEAYPAVAVEEAEAPERWEDLHPELRANLELALAQAERGETLSAEEFDAFHSKLADELGG